MQSAFSNCAISQFVFLLYCIIAQLSTYFLQYFAIFYLLSLRNIVISIQGGTENGSTC
nr:MAG TPA: hypothetical protein [Caudoviricetes sp.]